MLKFYKCKSNDNGTKSVYLFWDCLWSLCFSGVLNFF